MRKTKIFNHITVDPKVRFGKPVIEGTRLPIDLIIGKIGGGMSIDEVMKEYDLTKKQILSVLQYAAKIVGEEKITMI